MGDGGAIPNVVHFVFGLKPQTEAFPFAYHLGVLTARMVHKPERVVFHCHHEPWGYWWERTKRLVEMRRIERVPTSIGAKPIRHFAHAADAVRLQVLAEQGGIYLDVDTISCRPLTGLLGHPMVMGWEGDYGLGNSVMLARADSRFLKAWRDTYEAHFRPDGWAEASVWYPRRLAAKMPRDIHLLPPAAFFEPCFRKWRDIFFSRDLQIPDGLLVLHLCETHCGRHLHRAVWSFDEVLGSRSLYARIFLAAVAQDPALAAEEIFSWRERRAQVDKDLHEIYRRVLGREPDVVGLQYYLRLHFQEGWSLPRLEAHVQASVEANARRARLAAEAAALAEPPPVRAPPPEEAETPPAPAPDRPVPPESALAKPAPRAVPAPPPIPAPAAPPGPPLPRDAQGRPRWVSVRSLGSKGGLGTQLFQIAAAIALARDHDAEVLLPPWRYQAHFPLAGTFQDAPEPEHVWKEPGFAHTPIEWRPGVDLSGLFQSEKYFARHADEVRRRLAPAGLPPVRKGTCSLHVRRRDFLERPERLPILAVDYYDAAAERIGDAEFLVFSDDPGWCRRVFRDRRFTVMPGAPDHEDFARMIACESHILADSAFSWWAAWLGAWPGGRVVAPNRNHWFGEARQADTRDLYPEGWLEVDAPSRAPRRWVRAAPCALPAPEALAPGAAWPESARPQTTGAPRRPRILYTLTACMKNAARAAGVASSWARALPAGDRLVFAGDARLAEALPATVWTCVEAGSPEDSYSGLALKSLEMLRRAKEEPDWEFLFKADDDTWLFPDRVSAALAQYDPALPFFGGGGGWWIGAGNRHVGEPFPMFCGGSGYVISRPALERAWPQLRGELRRLAYEEDLLVAESMWRAGIEATEMPVDMIRGRDLTAARECAIATAHYIGPAEMEELHERQQQREEPFHVAGRRVGWGRVGLGGALGYAGRRVTVDGQPQSRALSAHVPSALLLQAEPGLRLELQGALDDSAASTAHATFEVRDANGELVIEPAPARRGSPTLPVVVRFPGDGRLVLVARAKSVPKCHTVWLWQPA